MGYLECINEVGRFLGSLEIDEVELRTKIIDHLANCIAGARLEQPDTEVSTTVGFSRTQAVIRPRPEKPGISLISRPDICGLQSTGPQPTSSLNIGHSVKLNDKEELKTPTSCQPMSVINLYSSGSVHSPHIPTPKVQIGQVTLPKQNEVSNASHNLTTDLSNQRMGLFCVSKSDSESKLSTPALLNQPDINVKVIGTQSAAQVSSITQAQIFGGLQLVPTQLPSGEIAFILPANIIPTTQSYVIPVLSPNTITPLSSPSEQAVSSASKIEFKSTPDGKVTSSILGHIGNSAFPITYAKALLPSCTENSSVLQPICDQQRNDTANLPSSEKALTNQSVLSTELLHPAQEQVISKLRDTTLISSGTEAFRTGGFQSSSAVCLSSSEVGLSSNSSTTTCNSSGRIQQPQTQQHDRSLTDHLVLNLAMQNRTRAGPEEARNRHEEDDESMWRPW